MLLILKMAKIPSTLIIAISLSFTIIIFVRPCSSFHKGLCIGLPTWGRDEKVAPFPSIGSGNRYYFRGHKATSLLNPENCQMPDKSKTFKWTPYFIQYKSPDIDDEDNVLFGWIHVKLDFAGTNANYILLQPWSPVGKLWDSGGSLAPGQIVITRFSSGLKESFNVNESISKIYLAPCYYASGPDPTVGVGLTYRTSTFSPGLGRVASMQFNYRLSVPECLSLYEEGEHHLEFRFFGNWDDNNEMCTDDQNSPPYPMMFTTPQNKIYLKAMSYGASDPEPPRESELKEIEIQGNNITKWVEDYSKSAWNRYETGLEFKDGECWSEAVERKPQMGAFFGRCSKNPAYEIGPDKVVFCEADFGEYRQEFPNYKPWVSETCDEILSCRKSRENTRLKGVSAFSEIGKIIWGFRSAHGVAMVMSTMFFTPPSTLLARHYKETLMKTRLINIHVWHGLHIALSLTIFAGLFSGWLAAIIGRCFFGFSSNFTGYVHTGSGYLSLLLFLISVAAGPIRAFTRLTRNCVIFSHFSVGTVTRILWIICLLTSFYIPASPSALEDTHIQFALEPYAVIVVVWIVFDFVVNICLMIQLVVIDKNSQFPNPRTYATVVPLPLVDPFGNSDLVGSAFRLVLLVVHAAICFILALILVLLISFNEPKGRWFGPMQYTHDQSGKLNMAMKDLGSDN